MSVVFVSHRLDEVLKVADRVTILVNGEKTGTHDAPGMTPAKLGELMTGQLFDHVPLDEDLDDAPPVLQVRDLSRTGEYADISFEVRKGEILGITGRLGSGRTELALSIFGMTRPNAGDITLNGAPLRLGLNREAIERGVAFVAEDRRSYGLVMEKAISSNIVLPVLPKLAGHFGLVNERRCRETAERWSGELGLRIGHVNDAVKKLSGGNQQRVVVAKWLETKPSLLILDSPTVGVDIAAKAGIYDIIHRLAADGLAVIMISDESSEVYHHAHRVKIMQRGRFVSEHRPADITEDALQKAVDA